MYVLKNDRSNLYYTFQGHIPHVPKQEASRFHNLQVAQKCAATLNGAGRGTYLPEAA